MRNLENKWRGRGLPKGAILAEGDVRADPDAARALLAACPVAAATPLAEAAGLAADCGIARLAIKDERGRMGLGSFKALGAAHAIAKAAFARLGDDLFATGAAAAALKGQVYCAATAGNHGLSIAAGARIFGARAVIYIAETVPEGFAARLRTKGAEVIREGADYEASLKAAEAAADLNGWQLLSDTSWPGYTALPLDVMEGYLITAAEAAEQWQGPEPSHIFLQAGVGGLAAAAAVYFRACWGQAMRIIVVEPASAPALQASIAAGKPVVTSGPVSNMGRLDCKEPSYMALKALAREADDFLTLDDGYVAAAIADLGKAGLATSPSGGAGYAGLKYAQAQGLYGLGGQSRVLVFLSEGPADD
ncbi:MAG: pyridoxal-phosphate dependent enzyme [Rhodobacteraceae bacterium]|nr:pyridoxal-phosphate dependent enzyme [Paracoccaceae bacterium]